MLQCKNISMDISIEQVIVALGYFGIFAMMISNGVISFPSSQVLYIIAGYYIFTENLFLVFVIFVGAIGNTIGNIILYEITRSKGLEYITKFHIFPKEVIEKVQAAFQKRGAWFVFVGKLVPALKVFVPIPAGITKMNRVLYATIIFISSAIWAIPFISIGYYFGKSSDVFGKYAIVLFVIAIIVAWYFYKFTEKQKVSGQHDS